MWEVNGLGPCGQFTLFTIWGVVWGGILSIFSGSGHSFFELVCDKDFGVLETKCMVPRPLFLEVGEGCVKRR